MNDMASGWKAHMYIPQIYNSVHTQPIKTCTGYRKTETEGK